MTGNFLAVPLCILACLSSNFWVAIVAFALKILVSGSYFAPALTMMQNSIDQTYSGFVVSAYTFYTHIGQTISPLIFSKLAIMYGA